MGRVLAVLAVIAAAVLAVRWGLRALRPVALVEPVVSGWALDAKAGTVTVAEDYSQDVKSELGGRLLARDFNLEPGEIVKQGEILAELDPTDLQLALKQMEIDYHAMQAKFKADQSDTLKLQAAYHQLLNFRIENHEGRLSDSDLAQDELAYQLQEEGKTEDEINRAQQLATAENNLAIQRHQIDKMTIRAPFDGQVKLVDAHPGDLLGAGSPIATLITLKKIVQAEISDEDFARIKVGQPADVFFLPYGNWLYHGRVSKILPTADPQTQRHVIDVDVDIDPAKLVPGINGELTVQVDKRQARTVVPRRAVFSFEGDCVYIVTHGVVRRRPVEKGYVWDRGVEITKGLEPGEQVIVEDLEDFRDGEQVQVQAIPSDVYTQVK